MRNKFKFWDRFFNKGTVGIASAENLENSDHRRVKGVSFKNRPSIQTQTSILRNGKLDSRESVDFETAISFAGYGKFNYFLLLIAMPASFSSGMVSGSVSIVLPAVGCHFNATNSEKGLLQIATYIGMISTGYFWGFASDSFGRKKLLTFGFILDGLVGIGASLSPNLGTMIFFKVLSGALNCGPFSIFTAYLSEIFLKKYRNVAVLSSGVYSAIGNILQPVLGYIIMWYAPFEPFVVFGDYTFAPWRVFLFACAMPSLITGIGASFILESPKFLLEKGRREEALGVVKTIYTVNTGMPESSFPVHKLQDVRSASVIASSEQKPSQTFFQRVKAGMLLSLTLFRQPFRNRLLFFMLIQLGTMSSMNSFRLWLPQLFTLAEHAASGNNSTAGGEFCDAILSANSNGGSPLCGNESATPYTNMIMINSGFLVGQFFFILCVQFFGKKLPIVLSTLIPSVFVASILFIPASYVVYVSTVFVSMLNVTFFAILIAMVEIFPTSVRATSISITQICGRVGVLIVTLTLSFVMFTHCKIIIIIISTALLTVGLIATMLPITPIEAVGTNRSQRTTKQQT